MPALPPRRAALSFPVSTPSLSPSAPWISRRTPAPRGRGRRAVEARNGSMPRAPRALVRLTTRSALLPAVPRSPRYANAGTANGARTGSSSRSTSVEASSGRRGAGVVAPLAIHALTSTTEARAASGRGDVRRTNRARRSSSGESGVPIRGPCRGLRSASHVDRGLHVGRYPVSSSMVPIPDVNGFRVTGIVGCFAYQVVARRHAMRQQAPPQTDVALPTAIADFP